MRFVWRDLDWSVRTVILASLPGGVVGLLILSALPSIMSPLGLPSTIAEVPFWLASILLQLLPPFGFAPFIGLIGAASVLGSAYLLVIPLDEAEQRSTAVLVLSLSLIVLVIGLPIMVFAYG